MRWYKVFSPALWSVVSTMSTISGATLRTITSNPCRMTKRAIRRYDLSLGAFILQPRRFPPGLFLCGLSGSPLRLGLTRFKAAGKQCPGRAAIVGDEEVHGEKPPARIFEGESQMAQLLAHDLRRLDSVRTQLSC